MQQAPVFEPLSFPDAKSLEQKQADETKLKRNELKTLVSAGIVSRSLRVVSGAYVFTGTRVPVYNLWDYLSAGDSLDDFLESFPTVPRALAEKAIALAGSRVETILQSL